MKGAFIVFRNSIDFSMLSFISCNLTESICLIGLFFFGGEGKIWSLGFSIYEVELFFQRVFRHSCCLITPARTSTNMSTTVAA